MIKVVALDFDGTIANTSNRETRRHRKGDKKIWSILVVVGMVKASAPGKVHLIGEHAVVYGEPAIIAAIGKRCYVDAEKSDKILIGSKELGSFEFSTEELKENNN